MNLMSKVFIAMGETNAVKFARTGTTGDWPPPIGPISTGARIPVSSTMRFIITPSDRFTPSFPNQPFNPDHAFPVGGTLYDITDGTFTILACNSDTVAAGDYASFFWLAIDEGQGPVPPAGIPLNQKLIGQPAYFAATNSASSDHQVFPNIFNPPNQPGSVANLLAVNPPYSFVGTIGGTPISTFGTAALPPVPAAGPPSGRPLVFVTANNAGCGVSPNPDPHNAAAVALVVDNNSVPMTQAGFKLIARNSDVAGTCGFNWVALLSTKTSSLGGFVGLPSGAPTPLDLLVDTGVFPPPSMDPFSFNPVGTHGDWASGEVQFNAPFAAEPVVLVSPQFFPPSMGSPPDFGLSSCAPVGIVQNVTRYGFTLAARNTDTNHLGGQARFYWVAFGLPD
jgi:hypothetical protein